MSASDRTFNLPSLFKKLSSSLDSVLGFGSSCYGYDHCEQMIWLARLFLDGFPEPYDFRGYSDLDEMVTVLMTHDFDGCDVVVTFGHALLQVREDPAALEEFAVLIRCLFPSRSCIVVAADAHSGSRRDDFHHQCKELGVVLNRPRVGLEDCRALFEWRSVMFARLNIE